MINELSIRIGNLELRKPANFVRRPRKDIEIVLHETRSCCTIATIDFDDNHQLRMNPIQDRIISHDITPDQFFEIARLGVQIMKKAGEWDPPEDEESTPAPGDEG